MTAVATVTVGGDDLKKAEKRFKFKLILNFTLKSNEKWNQFRQW